MAYALEKVTRLPPGDGYAGMLKHPHPTKLDHTVQVYGSGPEAEAVLAARLESMGGGDGSRT